MDKLRSVNPRTGELVRELDRTLTQDLPTIFSRAAAAQKSWAALSVKTRAKALLRLRECLIDEADSIAELISRENGKPLFEAYANEVAPSVDMLGFFARTAPRTLRDRAIPMAIMKHRTSRMNYWPLGTVVIISPWNYPFLLPFGEIMMALVAGNSIVFKPSEITPSIGLKIQELIENAGFPSHLVQTVIGDGALGAALIEQKPAKIFFTGSVATGKRVMAAAAAHLIPVNLELGGKDPMIVLPDADLDYATSAALWGGFSNAGQVCASIERLILHEKIAEPFLNQLKEKIGKLRRGEDLGPITLPKQKDTYARHLDQARAKDQTFLCGGSFSTDRRYLDPTLVTGPEIESLDIYNEETFGPVIAATTFKSVSEAIEKANGSAYGLVASVMTKNAALGEEIARQLEYGTVIVNEVTYTAGLGETPWGGVKESGIGRSHSEIGLYEFVNVRHIHAPRSRALVFKSPWWFPYTPHQHAMFRSFLQMFRQSWLQKIKALPMLVWNFAQMLKNEPRI